MYRTTKNVYSDLISETSQRFISEQTNAYRLISLAVIILAFSNATLDDLKTTILSSTVALWFLVLSIIVLIFCTYRWCHFYYLIEYSVLPEELSRYRKSEIPSILIIFSVPTVCIIFGVLSLIFRVT